MQRLQTRTDLVLFAQENCRSYSCERAFLTVKVVVLGGFDPIPPGTAPGWIVLVTSIHKRKWILAVIPDDIKHCYCVKWLDKIPWANWNGSSRTTYRDMELPGGWKYTIRDGDIPFQAFNAHLNALREADDE